MDQLRTIFAWLKKQHFWVLSVLVALIGIFCWWSAAGTLSKQFKDNEAKITAEFTNLTTLRNKPFHPNDDINKRQVDETEKLSAEVAKLWQQLYDRQRENVLQWPAALNQSFRDYVEKLEFGNDIPTDLREHYQNYVWRHFPALPEKINARPIDEDAAPGAVGGGEFSRVSRGSFGPERGIGPAGQLQDDEGNFVCEWLESDQAAVRAELEFPQQPSPLRIWVTQENLWVYHTLLDVIKNTNEAAGASRKSNAAVRTLYSLEVGQRAAPYSRTPNRIYKVPAPAAAAAEPGMAGEFPAEGSPEGEPGGMRMPGAMEFGQSGLAEGGSGAMTEAEEAAILLSYRYLGEDGKPIAGGGGGMEAGGEAVSTDPAATAATIDTSLFGKEYKRLPVRMVLEMDQRHLPRLIAECAIRPLQVEVQEVRINVPDAIGADGGGGPGYRSGYGEGGLGGGGNPFPELTGLQPFPPQPQIATVVIQGVIYIFNKPDLESLKPSQDDPSLAQAP